MAKLTIEQVRERFENRNFVLRSTEYVGTYNKLEVTCPEGHEIKMAHNSFQQGNGCSVCNNNSKKLTYEQVKYQFEKNGTVLRSKEYVNSGTKLEVTCPEGHDYEVSYNTFQQGNGCPKCYGNQKLTIEQVKEIAEVDGTELLSTVYVNNSTKLEGKCPEGHLYGMCYGNFGQGQRCPKCAGNGIPNISQMKELAEKDGTELLSTKYVSSKIKLEGKCPEGHLYGMGWSNFQTGQRCPKCAGNQRLTIEYIKEQTEQSIGFKLLSTKYINNHTNLEFECPSEHKFEMGGNNFKQRRICPICANNGTSKVERELQELVKKSHPTMIENDRTQILNPDTGHYLELDIGLPDLMKAIEYNGEYGHDKPKVKIRDKIKQEQCDKLGIDLLIINEQDYINNKEREIQKIMEFID